MADTYAELHFPVGGLDVSGPFGEQRPRALPAESGEQQVYGRTCAVGKNVRATEASTLRRRGGTRPGTVKYIPAAPVADWLIQELAQIVVNDAEGVG